MDTTEIDNTLDILKGLREDRLEEKAIRRQSMKKYIDAAIVINERNDFRREMKDLLRETIDLSKKANRMVKKMEKDHEKFQEKFICKPLNEKQKEKLRKVISDGGIMKFDMKKFQKRDLLVNILTMVYLSSANRVILKFMRKGEAPKYVTINEMNVYRLRRLLLHGELRTHKDEEDIENYDSIILEEWVKWEQIIVMSKPKSLFYKKRVGGFFKYTVKENIYFDAWRRYGLFKQVNAEDHKENCLYTAIINSNVQLTPVQIVSMKGLLLTREVPFTLVDKVAEELDIEIYIKYYSGGKSRNRTSNKGGGEKIIIGCVDDHYFAIDRLTNITSYALRNFEEIQDEKEWNLILKKRGKYYERTRKAELLIDSYDLITSLYENSEIYLDEISLATPGILETQFYSKVTKKIEQLEYISKINTRFVAPPKRFIEKESEDGKFILKSEPINGNRIVFADFETIPSDDEHIPFLLNAEYYEQPYGSKKAVISRKSFKKPKNSSFELGSSGFKFIVDFMDTLKNKDIVIFHNLGYDWRFLIKFGGPKILILSPIIVGNKVLQSSVMYKKRKILFKDSLAMIPKSLKGFPEMFNLKVNKEVMNYKAYNADTISQDTMKISEFMIEFNSADRKVFLENIDKLNFRKGDDEFDHMAYVDYYCSRDIEVLRKGYLIFRNWIFEICKEANIKRIDILNVISTASLAKTIFSLSGCFDGCSEFSGHVQQFIQRACVGGKCMTRDNKAYHIKQKKTIIDDKTKKRRNLLNSELSFMDDFDAVNLYGSAMFRMPGFIKGLPLVIKSDELLESKLKKYTYYYVEVEVLNIPKKLPFPLISVIDENGIRKFCNSIRGTTFLDKVGLEDAMEFHEMVEGRDFKIIRGYYFNDGFNPKVKDVIKFLFEKRLEKKEQKNPIQEVYKLIMNSAYGKLIEKAKEHSTKVINYMEEAEKYLDRNHNFVKDFTIMNEGEFYERYLIKVVSPIDKHFNQSHNGCLVLSTSKRIMNEVQSIAHENRIGIFYQDTDSMHLNAGVNNANVKLLGDKFEEKYGRELIGKRLGQFHCDFSFPEAKNPKSEEALFLGKKMYLHRLVGESYKGGLVRKEHCRLKGVPAFCLEGRAYKDFVYLKTGRARNYAISDIAIEKNRPLFKFCKDYTIQNNMVLSRRVKCYSKVIEVAI